MKLQILIPQYNETDDIIKPLLDSISLQQGINFDDVGVIIVNDGTNTRLSDSLINSYPFSIQYYLNDHKGVSTTRNSCLDYATAEYVMFCDSDDMFYSVCGLYIILREIEIGFDSLVSVFIEEVINKLDNQIVFVNHDMDSTFVHGKVHRRSYLIENNIRFCDRLTIHEDSYFNILTQNLSQNVKYCTTPFYLWKWRDDSICRHDPKYILKTYPNMLDSNDALVDEFYNRGLYDKAKLYSVLMIFDAYYTMNKPEWIEQDNKQYRDDTELRFAKYFNKHRAKWDDTSLAEKMQISNGVRTRIINEGMMMENQSIDNWLKYIEDLLC